MLGIVLFFTEYTLTLMIWGVIMLGPAILLWSKVSARTGDAGFP